MFQAVYKDMYIKALEDENKALKDLNSKLRARSDASLMDYLNMKTEVEMWIEDYKILLRKNKELKESLTAVVVRMFCE